MQSSLMNGMVAVTIHWDLGLGCLLKPYRCSYCPIGVGGAQFIFLPNQHREHMLPHSHPLHSVHQHASKGFLNAFLCLFCFYPWSDCPAPWPWMLSGWAVPARCHPNVSCFEGGFDDNHKEKRLSRKLVRSIKRWAASVMTARLPAMCPPRGGRTFHGIRDPECN